MNLRSTVATFVISLAACPFVLRAAQRDALQDGGRVPDAVDRGMLLDAWQMQQRLHPPLAPPGQVFSQAIIGLPTATRRPLPPDPFRSPTPVPISSFDWTKTCAWTAVMVAVCVLAYFAIRRRKKRNV